MVTRDKEFILWWDELGIEDIPLVGGKNASLGEMYRALTKKGVRASAEEVKKNPRARSATLRVAEKI